MKRAVHASLLLVLSLILPCSMRAQELFHEPASAHPDSGRSTGVRNNVLVMTAEELLRPRPGHALANMPALFFHDRGAPGQWLSFSGFGSSAREVGLTVDGIDLRDPIRGTVDLTTLPTFWVASVQLEPIWQRWEAPRAAAGATLRAVSCRHDGPRPLSHVGYENGDWGVRAVDVGLGMKLSPKTDVLAGVLLAGFDGFGPRQQYDAQRIRATVGAQLDQNWQAKYTALLTKAEAEVTPSPTEIALRSAIYPVTKDRRLDHALVVTGRWRSALAVEATFAHTELSREFHDYPLRLRWLDDARVLALAVSASRTRGPLAGMVGASLQGASLCSERMGKHADLEGRMRLGLRVQPHHGLQVALLLDGLGQLPGTLYVAPALQAKADLSPEHRFTLDASREVFFPSFQERYAVAPVRGDQHLQPWAVHRLVAALATQHEWCAWYAGLFLRQSAHEVMGSMTEAKDGLVFRQSNAKHRLAGLVGAAKAQPFSRLQLRGALTVQRALFGDERPPELPEWFASLSVGYGVALFGSDLDLTGRLSCTLLGPRCDVTLLHRLGAVAVPGAEFEARIMHNASVWVRIDNLLSFDYQVVWGYPMPKQFFTWGVNWTFVD
ncbi:MAG: hypothetical protein ONB15_00845 [candidate division KSB1 bacterium]|nr:hypothetical protein [candidate division KSB1 bacterium]